MASSKRKRTPSGKRQPYSPKRPYSSARTGAFIMLPPLLISEQSSSGADTRTLETLDTIFTRTFTPAASLAG